MQIVRDCAETVFLCRDETLGFFLYLQKYLFCFLSCVTHRINLYADRYRPVRQKPGNQQRIAPGMCSVAASAQLFACCKASGMQTYIKGGGREEK